MKAQFFLILFSVAIVTQAQVKKVYTNTSGELIFSLADVSTGSSNSGSGNVLRFSPVVNIQNWVNIDKSDHFGLFTGFSVRNVGFIYDVDANTRKKYRTYNIGIPLGIKIGNLSDMFFFAGYELEIPIHYKEKTFINEDKTDKIDVWFSNRVTTFNHSLMAGVQLPHGATLKFKYYLTNFFNKDYSESDGAGNTITPFANSNVNVFYFSLSFGLLKNTGFYYKKD